MHCIQSIGSPAELVLVEREVIILGGGLAGISTAVHLLKHGIKATLVEQRPFLGGRAFSFRDRFSGEEIDNGQHVILGVCNEFLQLLSDLGTRNEIELGPSLDVPVAFKGKVTNLRANRFFGNAFALVRYSHLSISDRISVARLLVKLKLHLVDTNQSIDASAVSFAEWLSFQGQSQAAIERFWSLFILPVFNCHVDEVAAEDAIEFTRIALLGSARETAIGYPRTDLSSLIGTPASQFMRENGIEVKMGARVSSISKSKSGVFEVALSSGEKLRCRNVVSALNPKSIASVLPTSDKSLAAMKTALTSFEYSPIVAVHLWYEKPVMVERVLAFVDLGLQWVFNDSALRNTSNNSTQHIVISLSGADEWAMLTKTDVLHRITSAMRVAFPLANTVDIVNSTVVKTLDATIKIKPGSRRFRFLQNTDVPGFYFAGDWTDTGLPATMEGAVLSGKTVADLVVRCL